MNLSIELRYLVAFVVFSFGIARLVWPPGHRYLGLFGGMLALAGASWIGATLVDWGGVFALIQQPPPQFGWQWLQKLLDSFWAVLIYWLNNTQPTQPALFTNLALIVLLLGAYAFLKSLLVTVTWALYSAWQLIDKLTRKVSDFLARKAPGLKPWVTGVLVLFSFVLALVPYTARLVQPALHIWDSFAPDRQPPPELPGYMLFLKRAVRNSLLILGLPLAILPYAVKLHPVLPGFFALLFWVGLWVLLLEIFQWLYSASFGPAASTEAAETETSPLSRSLEALYRAYLQLHNDPEIGHKALLFFNHRSDPRPDTPSPASVSIQPTATLAASLRQRLGNYLPPTLLETLTDSATRYENGHDLLFTETLCCYHFLLLAELIQYHHNRSEAVLLLCPHAAIDQVEAALEQQVRLHQLPLTQRWAVLGRDTLGPDAQVNVLISPDTALETHLFQQLSNLTSILQRLRLFICLDIQDLRLSSLRLTLGRLWLLQSRDKLRVVAQAQPYQAMEQQVRYLSEFMPDLVQCRLNPQLLAQRYLLVWNEHTARQNALAQHYFPRYTGALELSPLLLLEPWQHQFNVIHLDPVGRHNEDDLEHLGKDLLAQHDYDHLLPYCRRHEAVGHLYAAQSRLVYQIADASNLALALDHNTNFSGAPASLLNVVCGNYLLRDYYRACLYAVRNDPQDLSLLLRPLAVRPQGTLAELARALGSALQQGEADSGGLSRRAIVEQFLNLVPASLLAHFGVRADWVNLQQLFTLTQNNAPPLGIRLGEDQQPYYSISPRNYTTQPRYYRVCNEAGDEIAQWPAEDHGLRYAAGQLVLVGGKFHRVLQVGGGAVRVQHQESESRDLRRCPAFDRRYTLEDGPQYEDGKPLRRVLPGNLHLKIVHLHRGFVGESVGYWELNEDMQPLRERLPDYVPLEPVLRRVHKLQNVAYLRIEQADLVNGADLAVVAFTLCAVFQDCLVSLFPPQRAKLAVVSPQSTRFDPETQDEAARFYHQLYPAWVPPTTAETPEAVPDTDCLEFYLFEDADHDLGVARVLCDGQGAQILLGIAGDYLDWASTQKAEQLYHAYGNPTGWPVCLDYAGALALINKLRPPGNSLAVAPLDQGNWGAV